LLSYSRLFALGLATGVIAMVINTVAELLWKAGPIGIIVALLLIGGHTFNIIINILGAYVHSSRLQYIEFFGKFFEGSGRAFKPLALETQSIQM
jgi:V/A-type H+-transporting ATPase subunit I